MTLTSASAIFARSWQGSRTHGGKERLSVRINDLLVQELMKCLFLGPDFLRILVVFAVFVGGPNDRFDNLTIDSWMDPRYE